MLPRPKHILLLIILIFAGAHVYAQDHGVLQGKLQDASSNENIRFATVTVYNAQDSSLISYRLSDEAGRFKVPQLPLNTNLRVLISYTGYKVIRLEKEFSKTLHDIQLGTLLMSPDSNTLEEVLVIGERPPIIVRNDTIEFNASSFKTLPNALVEDLLKKLPGVVLERDGSITVNGRPVNRIQVDGKEFFGNDFKIATKNLPADMIDKVQVMNDQELGEDNIFHNPANAGQVINLKLKKGVKKGLFGKAYAGMGTKQHYEVGGILNMFRDTLQVSLLGYSNDINRIGFTIGEVGELGGFQRSGLNSVMIYRGEGFALDGISFGNVSGGLEQSTGGGINLNTEFGKNVTANFRYFYGTVNTTLEESTESSLFLNDTTLNTRSRVNRAGNNQSHRFGTSIKWRLSPLATLNIKPSIILSTSDQLSTTTASTEHSFKGLLNTSNIEQRFDRKFDSYYTTMDFVQKFKKSGRMLSIYSNFSQVEDHSGDQNIAAIDYHTGGADNTLQNQLRIMGTPLFSWNTSLGFSEPLSQSFGVRINQSINYSKKGEHLDVLDRVAGSAQELPNKELSYLLDQRAWTYITTVGVNWKIEKFSIVPGVNYQKLTINNSFDKFPNSKLEYDNILPRLTVDWNAKLYLDYSSALNAPNVRYLQPVINNANPLFVQLGNPNLKPELSNRLSLSYRYFKSAYQTSYSLSINGSTNKDGIIFIRSINSDGVQTTMPVNSPLAKNVRVEFKPARRFKIGKQLELNASNSLAYNFSRSFLVVNQHSAYQIQQRISESLRLNFNWNDKVEWNQEYSVVFNFSKYTNDYYQKLNTTTHYVRTDLIVRAIKNIVLETSGDYVVNAHVDPSIPAGAARWNAAINYNFLPKKKGTLKLHVYDILNQNRNVFREVKENAITIINTTSLQRYFLLSFIYNISDFATKKAGGRNSLLGI